MHYTEEWERKAKSWCGWKWQMEQFCWGKRSWGENSSTFTTNQKKSLINWKSLKSPNTEHCNRSWQWKPDDGHTRGYQQLKNHRCPEWTPSWCPFLHMKCKTKLASRVDVREENHGITNITSKKSELLLMRVKGTALGVMCKGKETSEKISLGPL